MNTDNADSQFTPGERLVAILLLALALGALFLGASLEGYTQSLLAETGAGLILFLALGLAVPTRLPSTVLWSITFLGTVILLV